MNRYFLPIVLLFLSSCAVQSKKEDRAIEKGIYYWKSVYKISAYEKARIDSLQLSELYIKFFDVDWNDATNQPNPVAQIRFADSSYLQQMNIIPVVFITNECILKIDSSQTEMLAEKIVKLVNEITGLNKLQHIREIQVDCDWTKNTSEKYFRMLRRVKELAAGKSISATIRLHQVKFMLKTGVPPVDKGLLMAYNMGNMKDPDAHNSILDVSEMKKYIANLDEYALPLDVALPVFEWYVLFRNGTYTGLVQGIPFEMFNKTFCDIAGNRVRVHKDTMLSGYDFRQNDMLRYEACDYRRILSAAKALNSKIPAGKLRVSLYHLDSITLSKYSVHELENMYHSFR